jgi:hypothetical protein
MNEVQMQRYLGDLSSLDPRCAERIRQAGLSGFHWGLASSPAMSPEGRIHHACKTALIACELQVIVENFRGSGKSREIA